MKPGCRKWILLSLYHITASFILLICGMRTEINQLDFDYSFYLGPDYKSTQDDKPCSTIVSNHVSWLDTIILIKRFRPNFAASLEWKNAPMVGKLIKSYDSICIPRGGSEEERAFTLQEIGKRQQLIEEGSGYQKFLIFAEGGTTNGTAILKFKKGAFFAEKPVTPVVMKYQYVFFNPAFDTIDFLSLVLLHLCLACFKCTIQVMPDFKPNDYLFETHANQGKDRWEIFAWAIRDSMINAGNLKPCDIPMKQKILYEKYMQKNSETFNEIKEVQEL